MRQHLARVADHEHGADRLAFAALAADLGGQVDHGAQRLQRHLRVELAQVLGAQPFEVLAQVNDAQAVDLLGLARPRRRCRCRGRRRATPVCSFSLATASSSARLMRSWVGVGPGSMSSTVRPCSSLSFCVSAAILGGDQQLAIAQVLAAPRPSRGRFRSTATRRPPASPSPSAGPP